MICLWWSCDERRIQQIDALNCTIWSANERDGSLIEHSAQPFLGNTFEQLLANQCPSLGSASGEVDHT
jgi:hypothetical protein